MHLLDPKNVVFPHPELASPEGIIAIGGDLSIDRLLLAYQFGYFPWYNQDEPILWWHPDPRFVLFTEDVRVTKSMRPYFNQERYEVTFDQSFDKVLKMCQKIRRKGQDGTWITKDIINSYQDLHDAGYAHSLEVRTKDGALAGGLYGVSLGKMFFGESMFASESNASKFALIALAKILRKKGFEIIDCQMPNDHLKSMGGRYVSRKFYLSQLRKNFFEESIVGNWQEMVEIGSIRNLIQ